MPTPIQSNQPSSVTTPSFLGRLFAPKSPERKNVPGITYSEAKYQPEAKRSRSVPNIPDPNTTMSANLIHFAKIYERSMDKTIRSSTAQVQRETEKMQAQEKKQLDDQLKECDRSSFDRYTISTLTVGLLGLGIQFMNGDRLKLITHGVPLVFSTYSAAAGASAQMQMGEIQAQETLHTYEQQESRDQLEQTQTNLSGFMEDIAKGVENLLQLQRQQSSIISQMQSRG